MKRILACLMACAWVLPLTAQREPTDSLYVAQHYDKVEYRIPMRDGVKLYTLAYIPKDKSRQWPILMNRTCYNAAAYDNFQLNDYPSPYLIRDKYILVFQDVRGRYQSEGSFTNMTPNIPGNNLRNKSEVDESSDTYDTIEWLLRNVKGHNGRVGVYGISYPGFYSTASLPDAHPALKAVSPQAPIADFFFDDFHHMGAYVQAYTAAFAVFGYQSPGPTKDNWFLPQLMRFYGVAAPDGYDFHLRMGPLKNFTKSYHQDNFFWKEIISHPNYDSFWQKRNILPHLRNIRPAVLTVGGWFDAEDLYGPLSTYKTLEKNNPQMRNSIVMGPWGHGDWARETGKSTHNHIYFGDSISSFYQREIEAPFFAQHLKDGPDARLPDAYMYNTGLKRWEKYEVWPPADKPVFRMGLGNGGRLLLNEAGQPDAKFSYLSDPANPVPYTSVIEGLTFTPRPFMSDDQRYAGRRPDVLVFETDTLREDITIAGEILAKLTVSTTGSDADFMVKLIDVYPNYHPQYEHNPKNIVMGGYQQLVRSEAFRGRFRNSFEKPEPFVPNQPTQVRIPLQDVLHTFKKGHRIMIQIHSTWFPYIDRNPQKYVENIFEADESDFIPATITVYGSSEILAGGKQH